MVILMVDGDGDGRVLMLLMFIYIYFSIYIICWCWCCWYLLISVDICWLWLWWRWWWWWWLWYITIMWRRRKEEDEDNVVVPCCSSSFPVHKSPTILYHHSCGGEMFQTHRSFFSTNHYIILHNSHSISWCLIPNLQRPIWLAEDTWWSHHHVQVAEKGWLHRTDQAGTTSTAGSVIGPK